jgi:homoserine O-acetyltransferase/O-succinyltransferase
MKRTIQMLSVLLVLLLAGTALGQGTQQFADLGDFTLQSGKIIKDCRLGYRTFGALNSDKSNAVLIPTWFTGKSADLAGLIGPGKLFDDTAYFLILADALGNGLSSSPSNSASMKGMSFPDFTIQDMVRAQHMFLTEKLHVNHLRAVMGISMGGMQTFQWVVSYPDFMDRAIPIVGTPCQTAYDLLLWNTELTVLNSVADRGNAMKIIAGIHALALTTPDDVAGKVKPADYQGFMEAQVKSVIGYDPVDFSWQLKAMLAHDITAPFGGSLEKTARAVKAKMLVIVSRSDHMVNPGPPLEFAKLAGAEIFELTSDYGHMAPVYEAGKVGPVIARFLK